MKTTDTIVVDKKTGNLNGGELWFSKEESMMLKKVIDQLIFDEDASVTKKMIFDIIDKVFGVGRK
jgi:hypothetical protein